MFEKSSRKNSSGSERRHIASLIIFLLLYIGLAALICLGGLCIGAKIMCMVDIPQEQLILIATFCGALGVFFAAWLSAGQFEKNNAFWGILIALGCWFILAVTGLVRQNAPDMLVLIKLFTFVCVGAFGAVLGAVSVEKRKKRRPHR